ncbi:MULTISPECIES: hypothetical protein [Rhizobium]|uniref:hypothetical protein n=1 Tax=Rhizobium TaxID=379 RepID=UPI00140DA051|nr:MULTISPECIES: hypothetical protein [Rhizobium]MDG3576333.1 hypothetical protein [Rhizobium sp. YJ-22]
MTNRQRPVRGGFLGRAIAVFGAAASAAAAVEAHRSPSGRDLDILGIDARSFSRIQQR